MLLLIKLLFLVFSALAFVLSTGVWFRSKFENHRLLVGLAGLVAVISTVFLLRDQLGEPFDEPFIFSWRYLQDLAKPPSSASWFFEKPSHPGATPEQKTVDATKSASRIAKPASDAGGNACSFCPSLVSVKAGEFMMGSPATETGHTSTEEPQHPVKIRKNFMIGRYKVTMREWEACVEAKACYAAQATDPGGTMSDLPVVNVSWEDAKAYAGWLSRATQKQYRLPSEAEWEYAARAGSTGPYSFAGEITPEKARYRSSGWDIANDKPVAVTMFKPNDYGLFQVHGNVWEWVEDCWHDNYNGGPHDETPRTEPNCERHVIRGGSWKDEPERLRSASRGLGFTEVRSLIHGFRVARDN